MKHKSHFLRHYPEMIKQFGPLVKTLRFEAKHQYFKSLSNLNGNRKSIFSTMTKRHQIRMYSHYRRKDFCLDHLSPQMISIEEIAIESLDLLQNRAIKVQVPIEHDEILTRPSGLIYQSQIYFSGDFVVLGFINGEYLFEIVNCFISQNG